MDNEKTSSMITISEESFAKTIWYSGTYTNDEVTKSWDFSVCIDVSDYGNEVTSVNWVEDVPDNADEIQDEIIIKMMQQWKKENQ